MSIVVRKMQESDRSAVIDLLARWNIAPLEPSPEVPHPEREELIVENAHVALDGERVVGALSFILHSETVAEGASFVVDGDYHHRGIGKRLGEAYRRELYERGVRKVRSEADRPESIAWLLQRGHKIVGTAPKRHGFGASDVDHWTVFELDLEAPIDGA